ncbi:MAG: adenosylcobinamide-phosphate synthase CbiB [Dehalococcoidia bacterium]|nr:adenosylcobinamide-phosphate synthase CbiB [Dehalococcoidia bacterium]
MRSRSAAFIGGVLADAALGDPPNALHPVVLIGRVAALARRSAPGDPSTRRRYGVTMALAIPASAALLARQAERRWPRWLGGRPVAGAMLLALAASRRTLIARAVEVADAIDAGDLPEARRLLAYHLVSRDTSDLDASEVAGATIESVAENLHDGVIAPWLTFALAGSAGAWGYRATNTLDALWGYHQPFLEELGMGTARLDDLVNFVPARVSAAAICMAAVARGEDAVSAWTVWRRDARHTPSPNAGAPMAAMAGALGVTLTKRDVYRLGEGGRDPGAADIRAACRLADTAALLTAAAVTTALIRGGR